MLDVDLAHQHLKLLEIVLFLLLQLHVTIVVCLDLFSLVVHPSLKLVAMVILHSLDVFRVLSLHFPCRLLDFHHPLVSVLLPLLYLPHQVLTSLKEPLSLRFQCFGSVSFLSPNRFV